MREDYKPGSSLPLGFSVSRFCTQARGLTAFGLLAFVVLWVGGVGFVRAPQRERKSGFGFECGVLTSSSSDGRCLCGRAPGRQATGSEQCE